MLTSEQKNAIVEAITKVASPRAVILFGSEATGTASDHSDIDIAVIKDTVTSKVRESVELWRALKFIRRANDIIVVSVGEYDYYKKQAGSIFRTIAETGTVLYAR